MPAALALTADPIASLVDTAFIGQIGTLLLILFILNCAYVLPSQTSTFCFCFGQQKQIWLKKFKFLSLNDKDGEIYCLHKSGIKAYQVLWKLKKVY